jgi:hypothetical protein
LLFNNEGGGGGGGTIGVKSGDGSTFIGALKETDATG